VDSEFIGGMLIVAAVLAAMITLVIASRHRIERSHRVGPTPLARRIRPERRG
jgi:hypothetical protein